MKIIKKFSVLGLVGSLTLINAGCTPEGSASPGSDVASEHSLGGRGFEQAIDAPVTQEQVNRSLETAGCEVSELQREMLDLVNKARAEGRYCGEDYFPAVNALTWNCKLVEAGAIHNADMVKNNFFAHEGSDGLKAGSRLDSVGYNWATYGENLAAGFIEPKQAMEALLDSPGHCRNIMGAKYREFGAASVFYTEAEYSHYWAQLFGTEFQ